MPRAVPYPGGDEFKFVSGENSTGVHLEDMCSKEHPGDRNSSKVLEFARKKILSDYFGIIILIDPSDTMNDGKLHL